MALPAMTNTKVDSVAKQCNLGNKAISYGKKYPIIHSRKAISFEKKLVWLP